MNVLAIIPARYHSSRFPGKPLADLLGKPMVWYVYARTKQAVDQTFIATDDDRIRKKLTQLGAQVIMTATNHRSGTERVCQAAQIIEQQTGKTPDIVLNVQGDEPLIDPQIIKHLIAAFDDQTQIATLIRPENDPQILFDPNTVKVITTHNQNAIYFSRQVIPYLRDIPQDQWHKKHQYYTHIGIYAYRYQVLKKIVTLPPSPLETAEKLEQLRWLQNGFRIKTVAVKYKSIGVDTPADLELVKKIMSQT